MALTDNMATFSALANDEGYENVFVGQIGSLLETGDVAIGISTSGNSPNVVRAMELAKQRGAQTLGFTGFGGGRLGKIVDLNLHVQSENIERVEDTHLILEHLICSALREKAQRNSDLAWRLPRSGADLDSERVRLLYEFNCELAQANGSKGVLQRTLGLAVSKLRAVSGSVVVIDESGQVAGGSVAYEGQLLERPPELLEDVFRTGLAGWAAREEQAALIPNTQQDARWLRKAWEENGSNPRSAIAAPVMSNGQVLGVLTLVRSAGANFTEGDLALVKAIALCASLMSDQDGH
jgi:D-sedoheptulose 7-phosphate isomerase